MSGAGGSFSLACPRLFNGDTFVDNHALIIRDGMITEVVSGGRLPTDLAREQLTDGFLVPGLVDLQVNGGGDVLFHDASDKTALATMLRAHQRLGTTALLPTILSGDIQLRTRAAQAVLEMTKTHAGILGLHVEGPWFAAQKHGAHQRDALESPSREAVESLCALGERCLVTLAPEVAGAKHIAQLAEAGVHVAAGHTAATAEQINEAQRHGLRGVTHLYNAMSPLLTREPGAVGAALTNDALWVSLIADGHHVHPAAIDVALRSKPAGKLLLVSDAMATVGGTRADFTLYGERIEQQAGRLINADGKLAGSAIALIDAVRYLQRATETPLEECLRMASLYPAQAIGARGLGRLNPGYRADIVHLSADLQVKNVWVGGELAST